MKHEHTTQHDSLETELGSWLHDAAQRPAPAIDVNAMIASVTARRPRPRRLAGFGSHWVANRETGPWRLPAWGIALVLLALVLVAMAVVASRPPANAPQLGRLAYGLDGDIYLADWNGANAVRLVDGDSFDVDGGSSYDFLGWAPDGRHFAYRQSGQPAATHIVDSRGRAVATVAGRTYGFQWSPDSSRLQAWTDDWTAVAVHGLDGRRQALLSPPPGYERFREVSATWAADGRSVLMYVNRVDDRQGPVEAWDAPIDGADPHRLADTDPRTSAFRDFSLTRDGRRIAAAEHSLVVANADGSGRRVLDPGQDLLVGGRANAALHPLWSPEETHILYVWAHTQAHAGDVYDLRLADVDGGTVRRLIADLPHRIWPIGWSPEGDRILFWTAEGEGSLWTVKRDAPGRQLLVEGGGPGEAAWQWEAGDEPAVRP